MFQYSVNKCVFSRRLKLSLPRSGFFKLSGREFQSDGPATEKTRGPSVLSRLRGTTKRRRVADRRRCRAETSDTVVHRGLRGTVLIGRASSCTLRRRVCTELFPAHPANEALSAEVAKNLGLKVKARFTYTAPLLRHKQSRRTA